MNLPHCKTSRIGAVVQYRAMGKLRRGCLLCLVVTKRMSHEWGSSVSTTLTTLLW